MTRLLPVRAKLFCHRRFNRALFVAGLLAQFDQCIGMLADIIGDFLQIQNSRVN